MIFNIRLSVQYKEADGLVSLSYSFFFFPASGHKECVSTF